MNDARRPRSGRRALCRGLTLVEILAATVLLVVLAGATLPILREIRRGLEPASGPTVLELARFADLALADPLLIDHQALGPAFNVQIRWTEVDWSEAGGPPAAVDLAGLPPVHIMCRTARGEDPDVNDGWLVFACADRRAYRFVEDLPAADPGADPGADEEGGAS